MLKLGVNIDHVATLRQARYRTNSDPWRPVEPDPVEAALACERAGCHGITAHLREDRRHIIDRDVFRLRDAIKTRLNFELGNTPEIVEIALQVRPDIVCLVPEHRQEVTTEGGLDVVAGEAALRETTRRMKDAGIQVSLFIDPEVDQVLMAAELGAEMIELHTGCFANAEGESVESEIQRLVAASKAGHAAGLQINAGHGINYGNLFHLFAVPHLTELNIGHSIVSRAMKVGLTESVRQMKQLMATYPTGPCD
jgi:pyridoxine 5-phosphate synthase